MFSCHNQNGLTLAELLVTTMIIGVIMIGMVSVDYAIRTNDQEQSRSSIATLRTSATLQDIVATATQASGDAATRCVQMANLTTDATNYICIYRDFGTPSVFTDDSWTCYTRHVNNLHKCTRTIVSGKGTCATTDPIVGTVTIDTFNAPDTPIAMTQQGPLQVSVPPVHRPLNMLTLLPRNI
jgi:prepilin-type N-terminal cleavage/methylation domain-containing protein